MVSIPESIGVLFLLLLLTDHAAVAAENVKAVMSSLPRLVTNEGANITGVHTIKGEVLRVERENHGEVFRITGDHFFVRGEDGKEVHLQVDPTTLKTDTIKVGDQIEATVDDSYHVLALRHR